MGDDPPKYEVAVGIGADGLKATKLLPYKRDHSTFDTIAPPSDSCTVTLASAAPSETNTHQGQPKQHPPAGSVYISGLPTLDTEISVLPDTFRIKDTKGKSQKEFFLRDTADCLILKADVVKDSAGGSKSVELKNLNGRQIFKIYCGIANEGNRVFDVSHQGRQLGTITITKRDAGTFQMRNELEKKTYVLKFVTGMDLVVFRQVFVSPLAKIHVDTRKQQRNRSERTNNVPLWIYHHVSITFLDPSISSAEKCLAIALAMAIMINAKENDVTSSNSFLCILCYCSTLIVGGGLLFMLIFVLNLYSKEK